MDRPGAGKRLAEFVQHRPGRALADKVAYFQTAANREGVRARFPRIDTLLINQDNGPENHSRRTQFLKRIVAFGRAQQLTIRLAYYPPYHSKYNPIERCWGVLENHWNGAVLESIPTALRFAQTMTWHGKHPLVQLIDKIYHKGVKLTAAEMKEVEAQVQRLPGLERWFVDFNPKPARLG